MNKSNSRKTSRFWKASFILLFLFNVAIIVTICILIYFPTKQIGVNMPQQLADGQKSSEFVVQTTKENVNDLVNAYLEKLLMKSSQKYAVHLGEDVLLSGELPVFSTTVPLRIHFEPVVLENGDLILKQKSIAVGQLKLPNKQVMRYVAEKLPMPDWVIVDSNKEEIYVQLTAMDIKSNFKVHAEQFDLVSDIISFKINIPYANLGIEPIVENE